MKKTLKIKKIDDLSLVCLSSEDYSYLWNDFTSLWNRYCRNLDIKKYLVTTKNNGRINNFKILSSKLNKFDFWTKRVRHAVSKINTKNLLVFTDDLFIEKKLDLKNFYDTYRFFKKNNVQHLQLQPNYNIFIKKKISFINYYSFHRISLQPSLWNKKYYLKMLSYDENGREFEENSSIRSKFNEKIYRTNYPVFKYTEIIRKGMTTPEGYTFIKKKFRKINKEYKKMSFLELFDHYYKKYKGMLFFILPTNFKKFYIKRKFANNLNKKT